jgi:hypothetical protein
MFAQVIQIAPISHDKILLNILPSGGVAKDVATSQILQCTKRIAGLGHLLVWWFIPEIPKVSHINVIFDLNQVLVVTKFQAYYKMGHVS